MSAAEGQSVERGGEYPLVPLRNFDVLNRPSAGSSNLSPREQQVTMAVPLQGIG